jgi:arylsulfatase A
MPIQHTRLLPIIVASLALLSTNATAGTQPNVVIIYGDDVGYGDVGAYGSKLIPTPNIDALAAGGIRFTDGHAAAATCTPSRFSMLTGIHGFREGVSILPPNAPLSIPTEAYTLPDLFKDAGYTTAVIGKWHLGIGSKDTPTDWNGKVAPGPLEIGFDYSFLLPSTNDRVPCVYLLDHHVLNLDSADPLYVGKKDEVNSMGSTVYPDAKVTPEAMTYYKSSQGHNNSVINGIGRICYMAGGQSALWNDETMADTFVEQAREYIANNKDQPFFLYFASQDIHVPRAPHPRFQGATTLGHRGDAMVQFDWSVGEILKALDEHGLSDNTIVLFSSDNGPVYDDGYNDGTTVKTSSKDNDQGHYGAGPYRGGKYQIYEGGTRVPFLIRWPAKIEPGVSDALVNQIDFMGSFAKLLEQSLPAGEALDSRDTLAAFLGEDSIGLPFMLEEAGRARALRRGDWKYIAAPKAKAGKKAKNAQLYDLDTDIAETKNLVTTNPEVAESMEQQLKTLMAAPGVR